MNIAIAGHESPLARATRTELEKRGHTITPGAAECVVFFPGELAALQALADDPRVKRLVLRSTGYAYGTNAKNPGMMTEERVSLLAPTDPAQSWIQAEVAAGRHPNSAILRMANI